MLLGNEFEVDLGICEGFGGGLECLREGLVVEESPGVIEFVIECGFHLFHGRNEIPEFRISDQAEKCGIDAGGG